VGALDVLPLAKAKRYLNIPAERTTDDEELAEFIGPAVQRVGEHVGRELVDEQSCTPLELLAVKVVLGAYWRTQRVNMGRGGSYGGGVSGSALEADSDPAGAAPIRRRLIDLLGEPADDGKAPHTAPQGNFPSPEPWPDPAQRGRVTA
jgi:hypothetical protein